MKNPDRKAVGTAIRRIRKEQGRTLEDVASRTRSLDPGNLSRIELGKQGYTDESLHDICNALGITVASLYAEAGGQMGSVKMEGKLNLTGEVPLLSVSDVVGVVKKYRENKTLSLRRILSEWMPEGYSMGESFVPITSGVKIGSGSFGLRVTGDSMYDASTGQGFPDGCIIIVDPDAQAKSGSYVIARDDGMEEPTFKQFVVDGGRRYLKPLNRRYPLIETTAALEVIGVVRLMTLEMPIPD